MRSGIIKRSDESKNHRQYCRECAKQIGPIGRMTRIKYELIRAGVDAAIAKRLMWLCPKCRMAASKSGSAGSV